MDEGVLFLSPQNVGTYLFNTQENLWEYVGNPVSKSLIKIYLLKITKHTMYSPTIRYIHGNIWAFQGSYSAYNLHLIWNGDSIKDGERIDLPEKYKIPFPIVITEDEYNHIC